MDFGKSCLRGAAATAFAAVLGWSGSAAAQNADSAPEMEENSSSPRGVTDIVVTATKRETALQKTAVAISAFDEGSLERQNINTSRDLMGIVPSLYLQRIATSPSTQTMGMRGLGNTDTIADPKVGVYIDDVYLARPFGQLFDLPGLERVEVLRGPQGTLYGRNSTGGAIRYITKAPDNDFTGEMSAAYGSYNWMTFKGMLSGPLVEDKLFASVAAVVNVRDGYTKNAITRKDENDLDSTALRAKLRFTPSNDFEVLLTADFEKDRSDTSTYTPAPGAPAALGTPAGFTYDRDQTYETANPGANVSTWGVSGRITWSPSDDIELKSITAYRALDGRYVNELDGLPTIARTDITINQSTVSQEFAANIDLSQVRINAGIFYFREDYELDNKSLYQRTASFRGGLGHLVSTSYAGYSNAEIEPFDGLTFIVGARYTHEKRRFTASQYLSNIDGAVGTLLFTASPKSSYNALTPKASIQYQWTPGVMTYASVSKGFQAGGFSLRATTTSSANLAYGPEKVLAYEAGIKAGLFDGAVRTNLAVFRNELTDAQVTVYLPEFLSSNIANAGKANTKGAEFEVSAVPVEGLNLSGSVSYLKAKYTEWDNAFGCPSACRSGAGLTLPYAPKWTASAHADYTFDLARTVSITPSIGVQYSSMVYNSVATLSNIGEALTTIDAGLNIRAGERVNFGVRVKNLTDARSIAYSWRLVNIANSDVFTMPRMAQAYLGFRF